MTTPLLCLLFFAGWTLLIVVGGVVSKRVWLVLTRKAAANSFASGQPHGTELYQRFMRAHANAVENLPVFASVVVVCHLAGVQDPTVDKLAVACVVARVCQSCVHIASNRNIAVQIRFTFYMAQVVCVLWMAGRSLVVTGYL